MIFCSFTWYLCYDLTVLVSVINLCFFLDCIVPRMFSIFNSIDRGICSFMNLVLGSLVLSES